MNKTSPLPVKILTEARHYNGFNSLYEYDLQAPSLNTGKVYAAPMNREVIKCNDSVIVLIYVAPADSFLFCEQFRTGVYFNTGDDSPFVLETPAGMIDHEKTPEKTPEETALKEVREETGLDLKSVELFGKAYASTGRMTEKTYLYYAQINEMPKIGIYGNPDEAEEIKTHLVPREKTYRMMDDFKIIHAQTLLALNWFKANKDTKE